MKDLQHEVSILIKTFDRQQSLTNLLRSLEKLGCTLPILIADDSRKPYKEEILKEFPQLDIHYYVLPFDTGLSAGRNIVLEQVRTNYFILCDDDFRFDHRMNLRSVLALIKENDLDIGGGVFLNHITVKGLKRFLGIMVNPRTAFRYVFHLPAVSRYAGNFFIQDKTCELIISNKKQALPVYTCDVVNNFFIARTDRVLELNGWDNTFKVGEHEDFFYRAKLRGLKVALVEALFIRHYPGAGKDYLAFRERAFELKKKFPKKFLFQEYTEINTDTNSIIFSYHADKETDLAV